MGTRLRRFAIGITVFGALFAIAPRAFAAATSMAPLSATLTAGTAQTQPVVISGFTTNPTVTVTCTAGCTTTALPSDGISFAAGTYDPAAKTKSGTIAITATTPVKVYTLHFAATNGVDTDLSQDFTLTIKGPPAITSASSTTFTIGTAGSFTVTTTGLGTMTITETGALPTGVALQTQTAAQKTAGTATISGTPVAADAGKAFPITITATNGVTPDATQVFTLNVRAAPAAMTCTLSATDLRRGDRFVAKGVAGGATSVSILLNGATPAIGADGVDSSGHFQVAATIPSTAKLGANTVLARGTRAGVVTGSAFCDPINVLAAAAAATPRPLTIGTTTPTGVTLPRTGMPIWAFVALAATLLEVGVGLVLFADSRRRVPVLIPQVRRAASAIKIRWG